MFDSNKGQIKGRKRLLSSVPSLTELLIGLLDKVRVVYDCGVISKVDHP
jgi:hypothetical protein